MRTNIEIDDQLLKEAFSFTSVKTKKEIVDLALKEFIEQHKKRNLMELRGKVQFREDYDYKKMREGA